MTRSNDCHSPESGNPAPARHSPESGNLADEKDRGSGPPATAGDSCSLGSRVRGNDEEGPKGLRQFLDDDQQRAWLEGDRLPPDAPGRTESIEQRFKYTTRFEKLRRRPQAREALDILRLYGATCIPIPRRTERWYWSVSCLPSTDRTLARVNASWMELFALQPDSPSPLLRSKAGEGAGLTSRFILHLADFTNDGSPDPDQLDADLLAECAGRAEDVTHAIWRDNRGILIAKIRTAASIRRFIQHPHSLRAIRNFNLTHMNRGRNAYQASHCHSIADYMVGEA